MLELLAAAARTGVIAPYFRVGPDEWPDGIVVFCERIVQRFVEIFVIVTFEFVAIVIVIVKFIEGVVKRSVKSSPVLPIRCPSRRGDGRLR